MNITIIRLSWCGQRMIILSEAEDPSHAEK
jgi:hypothetical protein